MLKKTPHVNPVKKATFTKDDEISTLNGVIRELAIEIDLLRRVVNVVKQHKPVWSESIGSTKFNAAINKLETFDAGSRVISMELFSGLRKGKR